MTRVQGPGERERVPRDRICGDSAAYRTDDNGTLNFTQLGSASADVGMAPRQLRLESQGANHRDYFNGVLMLSYIDSVYTTGQPGLADSVFGGAAVNSLITDLSPTKGCSPESIFFTTTRFV